MGEHRCLPAWSPSEEVYTARMRPRLQLLQGSKSFSQVDLRHEVGEWRRLGTFRPSLAPGVGFVPSPGEWHQLTVSRNGGRRKAELTLPAGRGKMGSWQVPLLLPKETRSEEATLWAGVAMALSQGFRARWVERPGRAPEVSPPNTSKDAP